MEHKAEEKKRGVVEALTMEKRGNIQTISKGEADRP
jgi:hypothetical protein